MVMQGVETWVGGRGDEADCDEEGVEGVVPGERHLLETVQRLLQVENMMWPIRVDEALGLCHVDLLVEICLEKCIVDVH
jgi:hypothetical protein